MLGPWLYSDQDNSEPMVFLRPPYARYGFAGTPVYQLAVRMLLEGRVECGLASSLDDPPCSPQSNSRDGVQFAILSVQKGAKQLLTNKQVPFLKDFGRSQF